MVLVPSSPTPMANPALSLYVMPYTPLKKGSQLPCVPRHDPPVPEPKNSTPSVEYNQSQGPNPPNSHKPKRAAYVASLPPPPAVV